jgi:hypothetical protein
MTNLGDLEVFSRVAASMGSMSAAGRGARVVHPAVISKRMKRLEERLGARLFQRTTRQISLTEAGQGFLRAHRRHSLEGHRGGGGLRVRPRQYAVQRHAEAFPRRHPSGACISPRNLKGFMDATSGTHRQPGAE